MLENFQFATDEAKRQLYVAMTRAKRNLTIHLNSDFLDGFRAENMERIKDHATYLPPNELAMHLTHRSIVLDYFISRQPLVEQLMGGDALVVNGDRCFTQHGQPVLKFSQKSIGQIEEMQAKGHELKQAKVGFIVYWLKDGAEQEVKIILPELYFERNV